jgi:hypothetical protein
LIAAASTSDHRGLTGWRALAEPTLELGQRLTF